MSVSIRWRFAPPLMLLATSAAILLSAIAAAPVAAVSAPYLVKNIKTGSADSNPTGLTALNDVLIFSAVGGGKGRELWRSDGTSAGTVRVMDIRPGKRGSGIYGITRVGDLAYFSARDGVHGDELWVTDGTALGTHMVKDIIPGPGSGNPQSVSDHADRIAVDVLGIAYFTTYSDYRLWRSDGTEQGTYVVPGSPNDPTHLTAFGSRVYFTGGGHLWRSDGTTAGTKAVKNRSGALVKAPLEIAATDSLLFYQFSDRILWRSDGTANGTFKVLDLSGACSNCNGMSPVADGGLLYFEAGALWRSDGTATGTFTVGPGSSSYPTTMLGVGDYFYFQATDGNLWATDGTPNSGHTVDKGTASYFCCRMADVKGTLFFIGPLTDAGPFKLFRYDVITNTATEVGPTTAEDPDYLTPVGDRLFFTARDSRGLELWAVNL